MFRRSLLLATLVALALPVSAQNWHGFTPPTVAYDGRFVLARLYYPRYIGWSYDWPEMEDNFRKIIHSVTSITPHPTPGDGNIFRMDDPELTKFPVAYLSEPGYWMPTDAEVLGLREYLRKGGFLIVDDFHYPNEWAVFERAMHRVLPEGRIERLPLSHPIFHCFFDIKSLDLPYPGELGQRGLTGEFFGIRDETRPNRGLMVVIDYNMDIGDYMEWSATGFNPVNTTNEAFKFGINYLIYGLSH